MLRNLLEKWRHYFINKKYVAANIAITVALVITIAVLGVFYIPALLTIVNGHYLPDRSEPDSYEVIIDEWMQEYKYSDGDRSVLPESVCTEEECRKLLSTDIAQLTSLYQIDLPSEPEGGYLLEGCDVTIPVIQLTSYIALSCGWNIDGSKMPQELLLFGVDGSKTPLDDFYFGMPLEKVDTAQYVSIESFIKQCEGCERTPTRRIEVKKGNLTFHLSFCSNNEGSFALDAVRVKMQLENI